MKRLLTLISLLLQTITVGVLFFSQNLFAQALSLDLGEDTLYVCANEVTTLNPTVSGGTSPYRYLWSDSTTQPSMSYLPSAGDSLWIWLEVGDGALQSVRDSALLVAFDNCIWPGDMNGDGIANHQDVLEWGVAAGASGPLRPRAHTNWIAQPSPDWGPKLPGGHDFAYADANGNGLVHLDDIQAIDKNYVRISPQGNIPPTSGTSMVLDVPNDSSTNVGDTLRIPVVLGSPANPVGSLYGIAFSLQYDNSIINSSSIVIDFDSSWLGDYQVDMTAMIKNFHQDGQLDIAVTRMDQQARSGHGKLFDVIVTIDNIAGKNGEAFPFNLDAKDIKLINALGHSRYIPTSSLSLDIFAEFNPNGPDLPQAEITIYPNPATTSLTIMPADQAIEQVRLTDVTGRTVRTETQRRENAFSWNLEGIKPGMYLLSLYDSSGQWITQKIQIIP